MTGSAQTAPSSPERYPWRNWTRKQWQARRDSAATYLADHPDWKTGESVIAGCDFYLRRLT